MSDKATETTLPSKLQRTVKKKISDKKSNEPVRTTFIDPFIDFSFKRLFASEESRPILIGLLNQLFKGRKYITSIEYGKNEYPGAHADEGGAVVDINCTDADGSNFTIEIQRGYQEHFKDRALFYTSMAITSQAPKGGRKAWAYELKEVYLIAFLESFTLPDGLKSEYIQDICLANRHTGKIFYDKLSLIFIEMLSFVKRPEDLETELDKWLYALKHLTEFKERPDYLSGPEFDQFFNMARYANLNKEEREMYSSDLKRKWDNKNVMDYAVKTAKQQGMEQGLEQGIEQGEHKRAIAMAIKLKAKRTPIYEIAELTDLSIAEIESL